jgi:hypothetical protein
MKYTFIFFLFLSVSVNAQILNAYAKVTSISGAKTTLTVTNVNETSHTFTVGGKVVLMQMQDDVIGTNTTNIASFGNLSSIANAGVYEIGVISSRSPAAGTPTTITLASPLAATFNTGANSSFQIISFRDLGSSYTTTANITGLAWDGDVGGVIAIEVTNTLTLNHSVNADAIGFRGGAVSTNFYDGTTVCTAGPFTSSLSTSNAFKGEGIYKATNNDFKIARGKLINGGGGGGMINAGGGGGGNYTSGGDGGLGWSCNATTTSKGLGGISLSAYINGGRIFMGGGGGGGQQNNSAASAGGNGGGIILIKAKNIATSGTCGTPVKITANGQSANNSGNDGAGGGGAGGCILLQVTSFSATATCTLGINANGGNGGNCNDGGQHAGGAGAGQGVVLFSASQPTTNVTTTSANGTAGRDYASGPANATSGGGTSNTGILASMSNPLPIELISFDGKLSAGTVDLFWVTASEINNDFFTVERSNDAVNFSLIGTVKANNTTIRSNYYLTDGSPFKGTNYYRLKQTDFNGSYTYSSIVSIDFSDAIVFSVYPNPKTQEQSLSVSLDKVYGVDIKLTIYDVTGKLVHNVVIDLRNKKEVILDNLILASGIYVVRLNTDRLNATQKLIIE